MRLLLGVDVLVIKGFDRVRIEKGPSLGFITSPQCSVRPIQECSTAFLESTKPGYGVTVYSEDPRVIIKIQGARLIEKSSDAMADIQPVIPENAAVRLEINPVTQDPW